MEKRIVIGIAGLLILLSPGAWGETEQDHGASICPNPRRVASNAEIGRRHNMCDARWRRLLASKASRGEAYGPFMERCERRCAAALSPTVAGGALLAAGAVAGLIAASGGEDRPASP